MSCCLAELAYPFNLSGNIISEDQSSLPHPVLPELKVEAKVNSGQNSKEYNLKHVGKNAAVKLRG